MKFAFRLLFVVVTVAACRSSRPIDVMSIPGRCDSVPPRLAVGEQHGARVPTIVAQQPDRAAIVGSVVEAGTDRWLRSAGVALFVAGAGATRTPFTREIPTDSSGSFAFEGLPPGRYIIRARWFVHRGEERAITVVAGRVDTLYFRLPFFSCAGY